MTIYLPDIPGRPVVAANVLFAVWEGLGGLYNWMIKAGTSRL